ncbi:LysE family translocator [Roseovarius nanhaiticus]|uniref:Threonine/homoserine/homoserine lactone efflux protein n=1 Tax=Roseovarius nanhaiticus TaxID=573024 RepID=A0A1N7F6Z3_9RHOB|nr:LysE family translocator [Roseovarius nanhaiticus]SEK60394.1 Threonine/homoserine/homoserine lactone efflux protein [Roseovarius nanhaiticus]SIR96099.1 Threonine/homoserine/homoserine lactone efflux protein [Roseovarius nanhaiticus]
MIDPWLLLAFLPAALALNMTPGADMMFCLGQGLRAGPVPAIAASAGIALGSLVHAAAAALGVSALVAAAPWLFDVIRWIGVAYLMWLALGALRMGPMRAKGRPMGPARAFREGLVVNLTNPKVILFVLAFLPQFADPARALLPQFMVMGVILGFGGFFINGAVGVFAGGLGRRMAASPRFARGLGLICAGLFTALAVRLAILERS